MRRELTDRVCVVTGASGGIGEATARAFVSGGAKVALLARRAERLQALADELGDSVLPLAVDVRDLPGLENAAERIRERLGRVDCLVNNAGVMLNSPFRAGLVDEWRTMVEINVLGVLYATHVFVEDICAGGGDVVNVSSVAGRTTRADSSVYNATKHAVTGWSDALRQELREAAVRVTAIEPGAVATELPEHITHPATRERAMQSYRGATEILEATDIAALIAHVVTVPERVSIGEVLVRPLRQKR